MNDINTGSHILEYKIWMEGFAITGTSMTANFIGTSFGLDFEDACKNYINSKGEHLNLDVNSKYPSIWGCRLYDNETDARKSFG